MLKKLMIMMVFACWGHNANSASFDCTKASSPSEKTICATPNLSSLDEQMAQVYKDARTKSSNQDQLKSEQINWIKSVRQCNTDAVCIENYYKSRISILKNTNTDVVKPLEQPVQKTQTVNKDSESDYSKRAKEEDRRQCLKFVESRKKCAVAADYGRCMDITFGSNMWYAYKDICSY